MNEIITSNNIDISSLDLSERFELVEYFKEKDIQVNEAEKEYKDYTPKEHFDQFVCNTDIEELDSFFDVITDIEDFTEEDILKEMFKSLCKYSSSKPLTAYKINKLYEEYRK